MAVAEQRTSFVAFVSLLSGALTILFALIWTTVLARTLTPAEFGLFTWIWSILGLLCVVGSLGMPGLLIPLLVQHRRQEGSSRLVEGADVCFSQAVLIPVVFSLAIGIVVATTGQLLGTREPLLWIFVLPFLVLQALATATARGLGRPLIAGACDGWGRFAVSSAVLLAVLWFAEVAVDSGVALLVGAATAVLVAVAAFTACAGRLAGLVGDRRRCSRSIDVVRQSAPFLFSSIGFTVLTTSDVVIAGFLLSLEETGFYKLAVQLSVVLVAASTVLGAAFAERFATLWQEGQGAAVVTLLRRVRVLSLVAALAVAAPLVILEETLITVLFGSEYIGAIPLLMILLAYRIADSYFGPIMMLLNSIGCQRVVSVVMLQSAVVTVIMQVVFASLVGAIGLAVATAVAGVFLKIRLWVEWRRVQRRAAEA